MTSIPLGPREAHVWYRWSDRLDSRAIEDASRSLSGDECARAVRFRFADDRRDYIVAHDLLRRALSRYAPIEPPDWRFEAGTHGKPFVAAPDLPSRLSFSLSHTRGVVACAIAHGEHVGVDTERLTRVLTAADLGDGILSSEEAAALQRCDPDDRATHLIDLWTLKEAFVKATGLGLSQPVDTLCFHFSADGGIEFVPPQTGSACWHVALFALSEHARLSVAFTTTEAGAPQISVRDDDGGSDAKGLEPVRASRRNL